MCRAERWSEARIELEAQVRARALPEPAVSKYRVRIALGKGAFREALRLAQANGPSFDAFAVRALVGLGDVEQAISLAEHSPEWRRLEVRLARAAAYEAAGDQEQALWIYERCLDRIDIEAGAAGVGRCLRALGEPDEAAYWFLRAQERAPYSKIDLLTCLEECLRASGRANQAARLLPLLERARAEESSA